MYRGQERDVCAFFFLTGWLLAAADGGTEGREHQRSCLPLPPWLLLSKLREGSDVRAFLLAVSSTGSERRSRLLSSGRMAGAASDGARQGRERRSCLRSIGCLPCWLAANVRQERKRKLETWNFLFLCATLLTADREPRPSRHPRRWNKASASTSLPHASKWAVSRPEP